MLAPPPMSHYLYAPGLLLLWPSKILVGQALSLPHVTASHQDSLLLLPDGIPDPVGIWKPCQSSCLFVKI